MPTPCPSCRCTVARLVPNDFLVVAGGAEVVLVFHQRGQLVLSENCRRTRQPGKTLGNTSGDVLTSSLPPTSSISMSSFAPVPGAGDGTVEGDQKREMESVENSREQGH